MEPDKEEVKKLIRNIRKAADLKTDATALFTALKFQPAIEKFTQCLALDELNYPYNSTIHMNIALALCKLKKYEEALPYLNKAVAMNP